MSARTSSHDGAGRPGHLVIIGGSEDRTGDKTILARCVELAGGAQSGLVVLTAASAEPDAMWAVYEEAFGDLGVKHKRPLRIESREMANDPEHAEQVYMAGGIFMTGGDQRRLLSLVGGTAVANAMHRAFRERGACIAGTSAGAAAMSEHMLSASETQSNGAPMVSAGLGFLRRVIIDQHFSERRRLARLLAAVADNPYLLGVGIDEDTALIIEPKGALEVIGDGSVTIIDGREMMLSLSEGAPARPELSNVRLHMLQPGSRVGGGEPHPESPQAMAALKEIALIVASVQH